MTEKQIHVGGLGSAYPFGRLNCCRSGSEGLLSETSWSTGHSLPIQKESKSQMSPQRPRFSVFRRIGSVEQ